MATEKLGLPTLTGNMSADVVRDMNALAQAIDAKVGEAGGLATLDENGNVSGIDTSTLATKEEFTAHTAETSSKFTSVNVNMIDMAVELETLKGATLNGVTANIFIETFQNLNDINLMNGVFDSTNKRLVL